MLDVLFEERVGHELLLAARGGELQYLGDLDPRQDLADSARATADRVQVEVAGVHAFEHESVGRCRLHAHNAGVQARPTGSHFQNVTSDQAMSDRTAGCLGGVGDGGYGLRRLIRRSCGDYCAVGQADTYDGSFAATWADAELRPNGQ
ncbi:hypothetical protein D9M71_387170 [compost metagenome]